jgi:hypothetical protein
MNELILLSQCVSGCAFERKPKKKFNNCIILSEDMRWLDAKFSAAAK